MWCGVRIDAFRIKQWGYGKGASAAYIYVTALPVSFLVQNDRAKIDRWSKDNRDGYQRPPQESRLKPRRGSVVRYLLEEGGIFPTSVLLNIRDKQLQFTAEKKISANIEQGVLHIDDNVTLWIIDGQHRIEALKRASSEHPELEDYPLPVCIMNLNEKFDELVHFYIVNSRQKKIPTAIAYRHMQRMYEQVKIKGDYQWLESVILGPIQERQALASMVVDYMAMNEDSPFEGKIRYLGEEREEWHLVDDAVLIKYVSALFKEKIFAGLNPEEFADLLISYWSAINNLYPKAFKPEEKDRYTLLRHTGIASFTYLFPFIYGLCAREGKIDKDNMLTKLKLLQEHIDSKELDPDFRRPIDESWWSREYGPSIARATSEATFREISKQMAKKINLLLKSRGK